MEAGIGLDGLLEEVLRLVVLVASLVGETGVVNRFWEALVRRLLLPRRS